MVYFMFYVVGILFFIFFIFLTLIFYKYLYKVCEKLNININKNILCVISIIIFYGSLVVGMMNKYVSVVLVFILYTILLFLVVMLFYKLLMKYKWFYKYYLLIPVILSFLFTCYGVYNMYNIDGKSYNISTNNKLNNEYKGILISDLHYGLGVKGKGLFNVVNEINKLNPDFVFLVGDIVDENTTLDEMKECFKILSNFKTNYGIFYSYGNHDENIYSNSKNYNKNILRDNILLNGINILEDSSYRINDELTIIGRSNGYKKSIEELVNDTNNDDYKILLAHIPIDYKSAKDNNIDLMLSGHTHAGQVFPVKIFEETFNTSEMIYGYESDGNFQKVVTSGIAGWGMPVRTDYHSEYVILNIKE